MNTSIFKVLILFIIVYYKIIQFPVLYSKGFSGGSDGKASAYNSGDPGSNPGGDDLLEKEMATHSNIFSWKIPWMEEPGRLQSVGSQRDMTERFHFLFFLIFIRGMVR